MARSASKAGVGCLVGPCIFDSFTCLTKLLELDRPVRAEMAKSSCNERFHCTDPFWFSAFVVPVQYLPPQLDYVDRVVNGTDTINEQMQY